jgi:hypothetical protein
MSTAEQIQAGAMRQRVLIWAGPLGLLLWVGAFLVLAGFIPPPHANDTAREILDRYADHTFRIRLGLVVALFASALIVPFAAVISAQIKRIEGDRAPVSNTQMCSAALLSVEFIIPIVVFQAAAYRYNVEGCRDGHLAMRGFVVSAPPPIRSSRTSARRPVRGRCRRRGSWRL